MKILIACETSGTVREAFRKLGHDAWSKDILPSDDDSSYHIQGDCVDVILSQKWDFIGMHLPCTYSSKIAQPTTFQQKKKTHLFLQLEKIYISTRLNELKASLPVKH